MRLRTPSALGVLPEDPSGRGSDRPADDAPPSRKRAAESGGEGAAQSQEARAAKKAAKAAKKAAKRAAA